MGETITGLSGMTGGTDARVDEESALAKEMKKVSRHARWQNKHLLSNFHGYLLEFDNFVLRVSMRKTTEE